MHYHISLCRHKNFIILVLGPLGTTTDRSLTRHACGVLAAWTRILRCPRAPGVCSLSRRLQEPYRHSSLTSRNTSLTVKILPQTYPEENLDSRYVTALEVARVRKWFLMLTTLPQSFQEYQRTRLMTAQAPQHLFGAEAGRAKRIRVVLWHPASQAQTRTHRRRLASQRVQTHSVVQESGLSNHISGLGDEFTNPIYVSRPSGLGFHLGMRCAVGDSGSELYS